MPTFSYLNFDLQFERTDNGYRVVTRGPDGVYSATFQLPVTPTELENLVLRIGRTRRTMRRIDPPEIEAAKLFGHRLYQAVFDPQIGAAFRKSLEIAEQQQAGLRVRVNLANAPELANLPWEYLYNQELNRFLALSVKTPLVRYLDIPERIRPLTVELPLRALAIIANPRGQVPLSIEHEWSNIQTALRDLTQRGVLVLDRLEHPTLAALQRRLRQTPYHIIHFVGHGAFSQHVQDGILMLEDAQGDEYRVSGQELGMLLHDHRSLRLALLNVCEGGRSATDDPFAGVAQSLVQQGIPAVIAMQFEVSDEAAIALAHEFYSAITDGYPVDAALAEARKSVFAQGYRLEWGTPVLYMRAPDGQIFDTDAAARLVQEQPYPQSVQAASEDERRSAHVAALFKQGLAHMREERWPEALSLFQEIERLQPGYRETQALIGRAQRESDSRRLAPAKPAESPTKPTVLAHSAQRYTAMLVLIVSGLILNIGVGDALWGWHALPVYLDTIGTILVGALLGPWVGLVLGGSSHVIWSLSGLPNGQLSIWYAHSTAIVGLIAGFAGRAGLFRSISPRWLSAIVGAIIMVALTYTALTLLNAPYDKSSGGAAFPWLSNFIDQQPLLFAVTTALGTILGYFRLQRIGYVGLLGLLVGAVTSILSAPVSVYLFEGLESSGLDWIIGLFNASVPIVIQATTANGLVSDPFDKLFCFLIAWLILQAIPSWLFNLLALGQADTSHSTTEPSDHSAS